MSLKEQEQKIITLEQENQALRESYDLSLNLLTIILAIQPYRIEFMVF